MNTLIKRNRKKRRMRVSSIISITLFLAFAFGVAWFFESQATTTVIIVRHAEKAYEPADDPGLTVEGQRRADRLAKMLAEVDVFAGLDYIYATEYRRTQETAQPLADLLDLPVNVWDAADVGGLIKKIESDHRGKIVLVVGHSDTVPLYVRELHGSKGIEIEEDEYSRLFIVTQPWFGKTKTLMIEYGPFE